jgi:hypothetical protein
VRDAIVSLASEPRKLSPQSLMQWSLSQLLDERIGL